MKTILRSMTAVCSNATTQDVTLDIRESSEMIRWTQIVGLDRTTAPDTLEVGLKRGSSFYVLNAETPGAAARCIKTSGTATAPGDFVPCARFLGANTSDVLELYAAGVIED